MTATISRRLLAAASLVKTYPLLEKSFQTTMSYKTIAARANAPSFDHVAKIQQGHFPATVLRNATVGRLYNDAIKTEDGIICTSGAIATSSGAKTGRVPEDKRVVKEVGSQADVWWGPVNKPLQPASFALLREDAVKHLDRCPQLYVFDGYAGWDPAYQIKVRVICSRPYHALFMHNMLIRPKSEELATFGEPDFVIYNAGTGYANPEIDGLSSNTSVTINFASREMVIMGTQYAGEMKKGVFTVMNYLMPKRGVLSMHCSANQGPSGDVTLFFGLSGTGKTTLSADAQRGLIGDDEHCWSDTGIFNIEGGCYAKCLGLSRRSEPEIFNAIRFGSVLENTVQDAVTHTVDYNDASLTQNTRASYPIHFIDNATIPCVGRHPTNIVLLTCDAFGILPPVAKLTASQAMYHFISGYTAKIAGTEIGVTEPKATFSACFGAAFLVWHPTVYAKLLAEKIRTYGANVWLVNTGWTGGGLQSGSRMNLLHTRAIIDAIHDGSLENAPCVTDPIFGFSIPTSCPHVPDATLQPRLTWASTEQYDAAARKLAGLFQENFKQYDGESSAEIRNAGPKL